MIQLLSDSELKSLITKYQDKLVSRRATSKDVTLGEKACAELRNRGYSVQFLLGSFQIEKNPVEKKGGKQDGRKENVKEGRKVRQEAESGEVQTEPHSGQE